MSTSPTRSQVALEFTLFTIIAFLLFSGLLFSISKQFGDLARQRDSKELRDVVSRLREEISLASLVRDGYSRNFTLPGEINRRSYSLSISDGHAVGSVGNVTYAAPVPDVTGSPLLGSNAIRKEGGAIYLN